MPSERRYTLYNDGGPEMLEQARLKAWEAVKSAMNDDPEYDEIAFAQFAHDLLDREIADGHAGFTYSVISQLRRLAATTIAYCSTAFELTPLEMAERFKQADDVQADESRQE